MKVAKTVSAWLLPAVSVLLVGAPLGCELVKVPSAPEPPKLPEAPEPPDVKAPDAPQPDVPAPEAASCCFRSGDQVAKACGGKDRCCAGDYDRGACESAGGLWFTSAAGCAGAC